MESNEAVLFLAGDIMTGRNVDQALPNPIAGPSSSPASSGKNFSFIWGDALEELTRRDPDVRIVNLETSITSSDDEWPDKRFRFRMHPANTPCLTEAGFDCCVLANNHVMDFGYQGLADTIDSLQRHGLQLAGAGANLNAAATPACLDLDNRGRVLVFALAHPSSYTPMEWAAGPRRPGEPQRPGINLLENYSSQALNKIRARIERERRPNDIVVLSIHWGTNWGYEVGFRQRRFAHRLIDTAGVDVVYGHSSHHPLALEIYRGRPILYGCGDFINDYVPTRASAPYRPDLAPMYFLHVDLSTGRLKNMTMVPMQIHDMRLRRPSRADATWLQETLNKGGYPVSLRRRLARWRRLKRTRFGCHWHLTNDNALTLSL